MSEVRQAYGSPSPEHIEVIRAANIGREVSAETRRKLSENAVRQWQDPAHRRRIAEAMANMPRTSRLEEYVREWLDALGIQYERQYFIDEVSSHLWDFALPDRRTLIKVDGCYWHACEECGEHRQSFMREKDAALIAFAESFGWTVIRLWGHDLRTVAARLITKPRVESMLRGEHG